MLRVVYNFASNKMISYFTHVQLLSIRPIHVHIHLMCMSCRYHVHIMCISCAYHVHIMCISCAYHVPIMCTLCTYYVHILCTLCTYNVHILCILWAYHVHIMCISCACHVHVMCMLCDINDKLTLYIIVTIQLTNYTWSGPTKILPNCRQLDPQLGWNWDGIVECILK